MTQKQAKKQTEKVYRSIEEFKEHFLPNFYKKELANEKKRDPKHFETGLIQELLESVRRELRR